MSDDFLRLLALALLIVVIVTFFTGDHANIPPCACTTDSYNCDHFPTHAAAQACFDYCYPDHGDIHRLDRDKDRLACESLP